MCKHGCICTHRHALDMQQRTHAPVAAAASVAPPATAAAGWRCSCCICLADLHNAAGWGPHCWLRCCYCCCHCCQGAARRLLSLLPACPLGSQQHAGRSFPCPTDEKTACTCHHQQKRHGAAAHVMCMRSAVGTKGVHAWHDMLKLPCPHLIICVVLAHLPVDALVQRSKLGLHSADGAAGAAAAAIGLASDLLQAASVACCSCCAPAQQRPCHPPLHAQRCASQLLARSGLWPHTNQSAHQHGGWSVVSTRICVLAGCCPAVMNQCHPHTLGRDSSGLLLYCCGVLPSCCGSRSMLFSARRNKTTVCWRVQAKELLP
jgi:hypothetical protein